MVKRCRSFPIRSWMDLPHVCDTSNCLAFHFWECQNCFCQLLSLSTFISIKYLIRGTFHPKRSSLSSPSCPALNHFPLDSNPLNLALAAKLDVFLHQDVLSSPLSTTFVSKGLS